MAPPVSVPPKPTTTVPPKPTTTEDDLILIPRQNKGLCTACDVKIWVYTRMHHNRPTPTQQQQPHTTTTTQTLISRITHPQIKWCKGCKNFKHWAVFGNKPHATKCMRCRDRQRASYQKSVSVYAPTLFHSVVNNGNTTGGNVNGNGNTSNGNTSNGNGNGNGNRGVSVPTVPIPTAYAGQETLEDTDTTATMVTEI
jgi:hypothetical protein